MPGGITPAGGTADEGVVSTDRIIRLSRVYHVGDRPAVGARGRYGRTISYEGGELSVSLHPDEWRRIAKLGGKTYELRKPGGQFLLAGKHAQWASDNGYLAPRTWYEASWYEEDENGEPGRSNLLFKTHQEAEREVQDYDGASVRKVEGYGFGPKGSNYWRDAFGSDEPRDELAKDFASIFRAKNRGYDGVWWDDKLDPLNYSAPRGLIFQDKLPTWEIMEHKRSEKGRYR